MEENNQHQYSEYKGIYYTYYEPFEYLPSSSGIWLLRDGFGDKANIEAFKADWYRIDECLQIFITKLQNNEITKKP